MAFWTNSQYRDVIGSLEALREASEASLRQSIEAVQADLVARNGALETSIRNGFAGLDEDSAKRIDALAAHLANSLNRLEAEVAKQSEELAARLESNVNVLMAAASTATEAAAAGLTAGIGELAATLLRIESTSTARGTTIAGLEESFFRMESANTTNANAILTAVDRSMEFAERHYSQTVQRVHNTEELLRVVSGRLAETEQSLRAAETTLAERENLLSSKDAAAAELAARYEEEKKKNKLLQEQFNGFVRLYQRIPGIVINTVPKSASIYIMRTLSQSLKIEFMNENFAHGFFPRYYLSPDYLARISAGNVVRQEHFDASDINIRVIGHFTERMILHLRDPRQATLSWCHHATRFKLENPTALNNTVHQLPDDYLEWPLESQLDWQIETHLVSVVAWMREWLDRLDAGCGISILLTTYEEMVADEAALFARILDFYDIPRELFRHNPAAKTMSHNFRKGESDEWRRVFTPAQKARAQEIIGIDLLERFHWPLDAGEEETAVAAPPPQAISAANSQPQRGRRKGTNRQRAET